MKLMYFAMDGIYPFNIGGTSTVAYNLIRNFDAHGIELDIVLVILKKDMPKEGLNKFLKLSSSVRFHPIIKEEHEFRPFNGGIKGMFELCTLVKQIKPDGARENGW